jgi:hypothetical protein
MQACKESYADKTNYLSIEGLKKKRFVLEADMHVVIK